MTIEKSVLMASALVALALGGDVRSVFAADDASAPEATTSLSPAAAANMSANRGKVIGAPCQRSDGYWPDWSKVNAKVEAQRAENKKNGDNRLINRMNFVSADSPAPLRLYELPPGTLYCLVTDETPNGYLTSNCKTDGDCPSPASCDGTQCRANCTANSDCNAPAICSPMFAQLSMCRIVNLRQEEGVPIIHKAAGKHPRRRAQR
jgi:hypothetical protein